MHSFQCVSLRRIPLFSSLVQGCGALLEYIFSIVSTCRAHFRLDQRGVLKNKVFVQSRTAVSTSTSIVAKTMSFRDYLLT